MEQIEKKSILLVEDEEKLARFVELELTHEGYNVEKSGNGREALELALQNHYDLILLDIMLPGLNGLEVLRRLLKEKDVPVILLTARDAVMDKVSGLDAGAVDYITKPFAIEELLARIRVALKFHAGLPAGKNESAGGNEEGVIRWKDLTLDDRRHEVRYAGHEINLTNREFLMLKTLLENRDIVLSRDTLLNKVCGYDYAGETNVVDVYIRYLRSKIDDVFDIKMIRTVRGVGYVIKSERKNDKKIFEGAGSEISQDLYVRGNHSSGNSDRGRAGVQHRAVLVEIVGYLHGRTQTDHHRRDHMLSAAARCQQA